MASDSLSRRGFLGLSLIAGAELAGGRGGLWLPSRGAPAIITSSRTRPLLPSGVQTGDVTDSRAVVWSRSDRPARMQVEWSTSERFTDVRTVRGPAALESSGYTAMIDLSGLPAGEQIVYRVRFESLEMPGDWSEPLIGRFRTAPAPGAAADRPIRLAWSGDEVGQGWGIDTDRGGMRIFDAIRRAEPDVFVHSGDIIYADQPLEAEVPLDDGTVWRNVVTEAKSKVAETLDEFRGNFAYNLDDPLTREFGASVPLIAQWDDHEVVNNWFPGMHLTDDDRYTVKSASLLAARARQALFEFVPMRRNPDESERIYRSFSWGPLLDVFVLDLRSYRGPNTSGLQAEQGPETAMMGDPQMEWLKRSLRESTATWKVIACDMPIGLVVRDFPRNGEPAFEAWANAEDGAPKGRELEVAELLSWMKREGIRNTVWITADVHYAAAHHYSPERGSFNDFDPFWEFVAGPMHAGTFGPNRLDATFGPEVRFNSVPDGFEGGRPPSDDLQFFGTLDIDPRTRALTAAIHDVTGALLWQTEIAAEG
ncbi:alkaline phosphatase D family protein [Gaopeijia maritima]|uniref:alkaline phosphatase D family protein n=1 Tax=Gaopeijia maritima TaxID=3119007 RepID=UPI00328A48F5